MPISWKSFQSRRNIGIKEWSARLGISGYNDLASHCVSLGIVPPSELEYNKAMGATKKVQPVAKSKPANFVPEPPLPKETTEVITSSDVSWNSLMTKSKILDVAVAAGVVEKGSKLTKTKLIQAMLAAGYSESKI